MQRPALQLGGDLESFRDSRASPGVRLDLARQAVAAAERAVHSAAATRTATDAANAECARRSFGDSLAGAVLGQPECDSRPEKAPIASPTAKIGQK